MRKVYPLLLKEPVTWVCIRIVLGNLSKTADFTCYPRLTASESKQRGLEFVLG